MEKAAQVHTSRSPSFLMATDRGDLYCNMYMPCRILIANSEFCIERMETTFNETTHYILSR